MFLTPLFIAVIIFFSILFFLNNNSGKGALQVTSVPQSKVFLEGKLIGITPLCACESSQMLTVGDYTIKLVPKDERVRPFEEKITINKGTLTVVDRTLAENGESDGSIIISLSPLNNKKDIEVLVISLPDKVTVFLDGSPVGITPLLLKQVSESDHDLRISRDGYKDKSVKIKTALGFKLSVLVFLGVNSDLSSSGDASSSAVPDALTKTPTVLILNTPTGFLRVRDSNSVASLEIARISPGETYELVSEEENWFEIKLTDGTRGWISNSYAVKE